MAKIPLGNPITTAKEGLEQVIKQTPTQPTPPTQGGGAAKSAPTPGGGAVKSTPTQGGGAAKSAPGQVPLTQQAIRQAGLASSRYRATKATDIAFEMHVNNLLSAPSTQILNMASTATQPVLGLMDTFNKALLTTFSKPENRTYYSEVVGQAYGTMHGIMKAFQFAGKTVEAKAKGQFSGAESIASSLGISPGITASARLEHTNRALSSAGMELDPNSATGRIADTIGSIVNLPVNALNVSDISFKVIMDDAAKHQWAMRQYVDGKYSSFKDAYAAALSNPNVAKMGVAAAEYGTFTGRPNIPVLSWITDAAAEKLPGMRWVIPFKRTIANLAEQSIERSPLVFASGTLGKRLVSKDPHERATAQARLLTGMAMLTTLSYTLGDYITGDAPRGAAAREQWQKINGMPFSLQMGPEYKAVRLDTLGVMGQLLKSVGMFRQQLDSMTEEELGVLQDPEALSNFVKESNANDLLKWVGTFADPIAEMMTDVFWMESLVGLFNAYDRSQKQENYLPLYQYIENIAARTIPISGSAVWERVLAGEDQVARQWTQVGDSFRMQIPELRKLVWTRYDTLGHEMIHNRFRGPGQTDPIAPYSPNHPIYKMMEQLSIEPSNRSKFINLPNHGKIAGSQLKLTQDEWDRMHQYIREGIYIDQLDFRGRPIKENGKPVRKLVVPSLEDQLMRTFRDLKLNKLEPEHQRAFFLHIRDKHSKIIKDYMIAKDPTFSARALKQIQADAEKAAALYQQSKQNMLNPDIPFGAQP